MKNKKSALTVGIVLVCLVFAGCGGGSSSDAGLSDSGSSDVGLPDGSTSDGGSTDGALTIEQCIKKIGWQYDFVIESEQNGFQDGSGAACTDASTAEWYMESATATDFSLVIAWDSLGAGTCMSRTPAPVVDAVICTITGTHVWEAVPGFDPSARMVVTENVTTVSGDFSGDGVDDQCGPVGSLAGTSTRYVVVLNEDCDSGEKVYMWQPVDNDSEAFPGNMYTDTNGLATPLALCSQPGTIGPSDHLTGRKICPTSINVEKK